MQESNLKNMIVLKNLPSNIVEEAIVILKANTKVKDLEKVEKNNLQTNTNLKSKNKEYITKEAEMIVSNYIKRIENKKQTEKSLRQVNEKYKKIKIYAIFATIVMVVQCIVIMCI